MIGWGMAALLFAGTAAPVFYLFLKALSLFFSGKLSNVPRISLALFARSVLLNASATTLCVLLGIMSALFLWSYCSKRRKEAFFIFLFCAVIPPFVHVHSWIKAIDAFNALVARLTGVYFNFTGVGAVVLTMAFSYLPFVGALCFMGLLSIPAEITDLLKTESNNKGIFLKGIFPYMAPYAWASALFVFLININEYAISSVFGVNVYALELFALFSASGNIYAIAITSLPLIFLSLMLLFLIVSITKKTDLSENFSSNTCPFSKQSMTRRIILTGGLVLFAYVGVPVLSMFFESFTAEGFWRILSESVSQIGYSFLIGFITAVITVFFSSVYTYRIHCTPGKKSKLLLLIAAPFMIPSAILGLAMIAFWNNPFLSMVYMSPFMPAVGLFARYLILPVIYFSLRFKRLDSNLSDELRLNVPFVKGMTRVIFPMVKREIAAFILLVFALSISEYGIVHLVTPPGYQMLTIKIYNYLHYGASEVVYALNLTVFLTILLTGFGILLLYRRDETGTARKLSE
jgi:iron(III) transport system permease protein